MNEKELGDNINTLRNCDSNFNESCKRSFDEVMDFMRQNGPLAQQLRERDLVKTDGNSLQFNPNIYPSEKK